MEHQYIDEYESNPFIARLQPIATFDEIIYHLTDDLQHSDQERLASPELRLHYVMRLRRCFVPLVQHVDYAQRFELALRQGYVGRNPATLDFARHLKAARARLRERAIDIPVERVRKTAFGFAVIGVSGVGKSYCVERVLETQPCIIAHELPATVTQVVWVKVNCPHKGSTRALCLSILQFFDEKLNTSYGSHHGNSRATAEGLLLVIQNLCIVHAVGVLIIDEIQNLNLAKSENKSALLSFLVLLVNTVGVPVILVGTLSAKSIMDTSFANARRSTGIGSLIWYPLQHEPGDVNDEWHYFMEQMWRGQWTSARTDLTAELSDTFYKETQGVLDLAVILYMICQIRLMQASASAKLAGDPEPDEIIDPPFVHAVALESFKLVAPMVAALRSNIADDLSGFDDFENYHELSAQTLEGALSATNARSKNGSVAPAKMASALGKAEAALQAQSFDEPPRQAIQRRVSRRRSMLDVSDLRAIRVSGPDAPLATYEALVAAGVAGPIAADFE